jgi:hypothetical protein
VKALDPKSSSSASSDTLARKGGNKERDQMVGHDGIEPSTPRLKGGCSAAELMAHVAGAAGFEPANVSSKG